MAKRSKGCKAPESPSPDWSITPQSRASASTAKSRKKKNDDPLISNEEKEKARRFLQSLPGEDKDGVGLSWQILITDFPQWFPSGTIFDEDGQMLAKVIDEFHRYYLPEDFADLPPPLHQTYARDIAARVEVMSERISLGYHWKHPADVEMPPRVDVEVSHVRNGRDEHKGYLDDEEQASRVWAAPGDRQHGKKRKEPPIIVCEGCGTRFTKTRFATAGESLNLHLLIDAHGCAATYQEEAIHDCGDEQVSGPGCEDSVSGNQEDST